jgi:transcriptional regulator with XRE-family HTH domain
MHTTAQDPAYVAAQVKLRKIFELKQQNLADLSGLTTRTVEKVESGRHRANDQTLRSIARARVRRRRRRKPTPEEEARTKTQMEKALRKKDLVPTKPIR